MEVKGFELEPGTMNLLSIYHDDWCGYFITSSPASCNCVPDVELTEVTDDNIEQVAEKVVRDEKRSQQLKLSRRN